MDGAVSRADERVVVDDVGGADAGVAVRRLDVAALGVVALLDHLEGARG